MVWGMKMTKMMHLEQHPGTNPESFDTKIVAFTDSIIELESTAFYPMGGGQPADIGTIKSDDFHLLV